MLGPLDYALWLIGVLAQVAVVVSFVRSRTVGRYFTLFLYMLFACMVEAGRYVVLVRYGLQSREYYYLYYYSDAFLTICLYFALMGLFMQVFQEMGVSRYLRVGALLLLGGTAWFSYEVVMHSRDRMFSLFVVELSQNLYFVGLVLTYLLWGALLKLRETRAQLVQLVLALGVYFSAFAANYALRNLYPNLILIWTYVPPLMGIWLAAAWAYALLWVSAEARLVPARIAVSHK